MTPAFIQGNNEALKTIWVKEYPYLVSTAFYYLKNKEKAEDVVSDVFRKLLEIPITDRMEKLGGVIGNERVFLKVVVKNKCLDVLKTEQNRKNILQGVISIFSQSASYPVESDFEQMLDLLPTRQKEVFTLHLQGYNHDEISEKLAISYQTSRNTLAVARKKIKQLWRTFMN